MNDTNTQRSVSKPSSQSDTMSGTALRDNPDIENMPSGLSSAQIISNIIRREKEKDPNFADAFYTVDLSDVSRKMRVWQATLPRVTPFYAVKANIDKHILSTLAELGAGYDCASQTEIASVLSLGVPPSKIVYANTFKPPNSLRYAQEVGVDLMTFDNKEELLKIKSLHPNARLLLRIRPVSTYKVDYRILTANGRFGCPVVGAPEILKIAKNLDLNVVGVSFHVGSGIHDGRVFPEVIDAADQVFRIGKELGFEFTILDIGGGFFGKKNPPVPFEKVAQYLNQALDTHFPPERGIEIIAEPGRYFTTSCATLTMSVVGKNKITDTSVNGYQKATSDKSKILYVVNDGRMGSISGEYLSMSGAKAPFVLKDASNRQVYRSAVYGPTCHGQDCVFEDCMMPELEIGDWIYLENMGAYMLVMGSTFNGMPLPKSFYVRSG